LPESSSYSDVPYVPGEVEVEGILEGAGAPLLAFFESIPPSISVLTPVTLIPAPRRSASPPLNPSSANESFSFDVKEILFYDLKLPAMPI
jgi:hypothetical protein